MWKVRLSILNFWCGNTLGFGRITPKKFSNTHTRPTGYASGLTLTKTYVYFIQRPLCKVVAKLSTELLVFAGYKTSYPQASVNNPRKNPVDNVRLALLAGWPGGEGRRGTATVTVPPRTFFNFLFFDF